MVKNGGWVWIAAMLVAAPSALLALPNWDPADLDEPVLGCVLQIEPVNQPIVVGRPFVGSTVTIDASRVKLVNKGTGCAVYRLPLTSFTWELELPDGTMTPLPGDSLVHEVLVEEEGVYTARIRPCAPDGCEYLIQDVGTITVPPQFPRSVSFFSTSHLPPETAPVLPASALQPAPPASFTGSQVEARCGDGHLNRDWFGPQLVTIEDWRGPHSYANYNADTAEVEAVEGFVLKSKVAGKDNVLNHHSHDSTFNVLVDPAHRGFLMECPDCGCEGGCPPVGPVRDYLHVEWETDEYPEAYRPSNGDRVSFFGFWVHDCGHAPFNTEIHPPVGAVAHRNRAIPIPADRVFPSLGGTVGQDVYVPGVFTEAYFHRYGGEMMGDGTGMHQGSLGNGVLYECPDGSTQVDLDCGDGDVGVPFEFELPSFPGGRQRIVDPAPLERIFTFNVYLPLNPKVVLETIGLSGLPDVPLYYEVLASSGLGAYDDSRFAPELVDVERIDEGDITYLRVRVDLRDIPCCDPVHFTMAAAWVYPSPTNWGLGRWRVSLDSMDITDDSDDHVKHDGEWRMWLGMNNAQPRPRQQPAGHHEWTMILDEDVSEGTRDMSLRTSDDGGALGPDLLLFPGEVFRDQKIHVAASGYEDDISSDDPLGLVFEKHDQVEIFYAIDSVCPKGDCGDYRLRYTIDRLADPPEPNLSVYAEALMDAYRLTDLQCVGGDDVCVPVLDGLPPAREVGGWHPQDETGDVSGPISETALFKAQGVEDRVLFLHQSFGELAALLETIRGDDPEFLDALLTHLRQEVDEARDELGDEVLVDVYGLRAGMPDDLFRAYFGDLPAPESPPGLSTRKMTGGGETLGPVEAEVDVGLHCNPVRFPNTLEVTWPGEVGTSSQDDEDEDDDADEDDDEDRGNHFDLEIITALACDEAPEPMRTHRGEGVGALNGVKGATAEWALVDGGHPGADDLVHLVVKDPSGEVVLDVNAALDAGNLRGHEK